GFISLRAAIKFRPSGECWDLPRGSTIFVNTGNRVFVTPVWNWELEERMATTLAQAPRTAAQEENRPKWLTLGAMCFALFIMMPGTLSIITATFVGKERAQAIGIWAGISGLALAAGPVVGGLLVEYVNWQAIFFVNVPIGILALLVGTRVIRESRDTTAARS